MDGYAISWLKSGVWLAYLNGTEVHIEHRNDTDLNLLANHCIVLEVVSICWWPDESASSAMLLALGPK